MQRAPPCLLRAAMRLACTLCRSKVAEQSMQVNLLALHWWQCCAILGFLMESPQSSQ